MSNSQFIDECLKAHNAYRTRHSAPSLKHDPKLSRSAQSWADQIASSGQFMHSQNRNNTGENIAMKWTSDGALMSGVEATNMWYSEIKDYTFSGEENMDCGHFSQVVWVGSLSAGFGRSRASDGTVYVVGQYSPAGNFVGRWSENVLPPRDDRTDLIDVPAAEKKFENESENESENETKNESENESENEAAPPLSASKNEAAKTLSTFEDEALRAHNLYRKRHRAPPLSLDPQLSRAAQKWADQIAKTGAFKHSSGRQNVGENIAMKWTSEAALMSGLEATNMWYSEIKDYTFSGEENMSCGHFSQVVWVGSHAVGFGRSQASDGTVYFVGQYSPAGNYVGEWPNNVLPPNGGRVDLLD